MTPSELAQRLSALDWSMTPLQNQLAVAAAISSLGGPCTYCGPGMRTGLPGNACENCMNTGLANPGAPAAVLPVHSNVVALVPPAAKRTMRHVRILHLDGREFASAGFLPGLASAPWEWIAETVAAECECRPEQVGCMEPPEDDEGPGRDFITVDGLPCYRIGFGAASTPRV